MTLKIRNIAVAMLAMATSIGGAADAKGSFFESLAGPGEKVVLTTEARADGTPGSSKALTSPDGEFQRFEATGLVKLESPRINLQAFDLVYDAAKGMLVATGKVIIDQQGLYATCTKVTYTTATGTISLTGSPDVKQTTDGGVTHFTGMEEFLIVRKDTGETEVQMKGGKAIQAEMKSTTPAGASPTPTPSGSVAPASAPSASAPPKGFSGFGKDVTISTTARGKEQPAIFVNTLKTGEFGLFRALGSVVLESETMSLRADQLEYNGVSQSVEALYNVFIKQNDIDADCGRMLYDLTKEEITLSVNPRIRQKTSGGVTNLSDMDAYVITKHPDGSYTSEMRRGAGSQTRMEFQAATPVPTPTSKPTGPGEIDLKNDEDVKSLVPKPK